MLEVEMAENNEQNSAAKFWSSAENDMVSWLMMNGDDLFPPLPLDSTGSILTEPPLPSPRLDALDPQALMDSFDFETNNNNQPQCPPDNFFSSSNSNATSKTKSRTKSKISTPPLQREKSNQSCGISSDGDSRRQQRLEKNREIARKCRKRKRERFEAMEKELEMLKEQKALLELKVEKLQNDNQTSAPLDARVAAFQEIQHLLHERKIIVGDQDEAEIMRQDKEKAQQLLDNEQNLSCKLANYKELYSDFGQERHKEIQFHLQSLKKLLVPTQLSKMMVWSLQQEDDFYDESTNQKQFGGGLWNTLCSEFNLSKEQKRGLIAMRNSVRSQRRNMGECMKIMSELDDRVNENFWSLKNQMTDIMSLTSPVQQARFLLWVDKNQACMYMLNNIWEQEKAKNRLPYHEALAKEKGKEKQEDTELNETEVEEIILQDKAKVSAEDMEAALKSGKSLQEMKKLLKR